MKIRGKQRRIMNFSKNPEYNKDILVPKKYMTYFWDYGTNKISTFVVVKRMIQFVDRDSWKWLYNKLGRNQIKNILKDEKYNFNEVNADYFKFLFSL